MSGAFTPKYPRSSALASAIVVVPAGNLGSTNAQAALQELQGDIDTLNAGEAAQNLTIAGKIPKVGIDSTSTGVYTSTLTYNEATRTITIAPTGASFDVFVLGVKYTKTSTSLAHTTSQGGHFFYFDETGTLIHSLSPWNLLTHAPVAFVFWDTTNSRGICFEERHHAGRDVWWHRNQHTNEGTKASSGFSITGYTLNDGSTDAAVTYSVATGRLEDEDIQVDTETLPDAGPYTIIHRSGASGDWLINRTSVLPFPFSGNNLQYNQFTGATWQLTNVTEDFYVNYWVFGVTALPSASVSPAPGAIQQFVIVPGQAIFATEAEADAETITSIAWGSIPFQEICPLYQVTMRYNATVPSAYVNTARCAIINVRRTIGTNASLTAAAQTDHGSLTGLNDQDHPASAIIFTPAGNIAATDVQAALVELDTEKLTKDVQISHRNKLINGNFKINQAAYVSGAAVGAALYGHDMWKMAASGDTYTFSITNNKTTVTIPASKVLQQIVEGVNLQTGTYCLSWEGTAQGKIGAGALSASGVTGSITGGTNTTIEFGPGTLTNVQLELGAVATPFETINDTISLQLCQRYFVRYNSNGSFGQFSMAASVSTTAANAMLVTPTPMRASPTLATSGSFAIFTTLVYPVTITFASYNFNAVGLNLAGTGLPAGQTGTLASNADANAFITLSARL